MATNDERAGLALQAAKVFAKATGMSWPVDGREIIVDLICDLGHLAARELPRDHPIEQPDDGSNDPDGVFWSGQHHFKYERCPRCIVGDADPDDEGIPALESWGDEDEDAYAAVCRNCATPEEHAAELRAQREVIG